MGRARFTSFSYMRIWEQGQESMIGRLPKTTQIIRDIGQSVIFSVLYCQAFKCLVTPRGHNYKRWHGLCHRTALAMTQTHRF